MQHLSYTSRPELLLTAVHSTNTKDSAVIYDLGLGHSTLTEPRLAPWLAACMDAVASRVECRGRHDGAVSAPEAASAI